MKICEKSDRHTNLLHEIARLLLTTSQKVRPLKKKENIMNFCSKASYLKSLTIEKIF